ncbi:rho GTPase-activating protein 9 isoform X2 [Rhinatrema bivittatum]|uniref:rho GTPase-activating protein 9 isoform X2 n=1 Tax=Rhinatrema bivittatum TaxID=194408 RepID=UPI00112BC7D8|nr:rho GTPase-activating protein 9 isoform X2 [Rhinatrema bivittatum]
MPGRWRLEGRTWKKTEAVALACTPSIALRALYDYQYKAVDGKMVVIKEGDFFILLRKSNEDWWQVRRLGDTKKVKPIFVPATYVTEVCGSTAGCQSATLSSTNSRKLNERTGPKAFSHSLEDLSQYSRLPTLLDYQSCYDLNFRDVPSGDAGLQPTQVPNVFQSNSSSTFSRSPILDATYPMCQQCQSVSQRNLLAHQLPSHETTLESSMPEHPIYSNLEDLRKMKVEPPSPTCAPVQVLEAWEQYLDPNTGRIYYVNSTTREKTWKPPRRHRIRTSGRPHTPTGSSDTEQQEESFSSAVQCKDGEPGEVLDVLEGQSPLCHKCSISSDHLVRQEASASPRDVHLDMESSTRPLQRLTYTKSMVVGETRASKLTHRRNRSDHKFEDFVDANSSSVPPEEAITRILDVPHEVEKAGQLKKTKIAEGGRKLRKNWAMSWVVLAGNSLIFFKEPKVQAPGGWRSSSNKPESSMDLRGAVLDWARDMSSRKNVIHLRMVTGNEFLLQSDSDAVIQDWYQILQNVIERLDRENPLDELQLYSLRRMGSSEALDASGDEEESILKPKDSFKLLLSRTSSNSENSDKKRVRSRLKKFIVRRPPLQALQEKGLIRDQVFGCRLDALCQRENTTVPKFVRLCIEAVNKRGLDADGIYRVNGNLAIIQKLRFIVDRERAVTSDGRYLFPEQRSQEERLNLDDSEWEDIHVVTGALKLFFRELPEPLIPYTLYERFVEATKLHGVSEKLETFKKLVSGLPRPNHDTLEYILAHLRRVMEHADLNRMTTQNIGIVFGPTLMRPEKDLFSSLAINMTYQNQVVEFLLQEFQRIFSEATAEPPGSAPL